MNELILQIHTSIFAALWPSLGAIPSWCVTMVGYLVAGGIMMAWMAVMAMGWTWGERRIAGLIQARYGPNRVGPMGLLQPIADGIKLLAKEDIVPDAANRLLYGLAPLLVFIGALVPFVALPFSEKLVVADMELGLYYILAFEAIEVIGVLMAGWAPGSKWSLYGGMRLAAQLLSYEIPMGLCALVIIVLSGTLNLGEIVNWQAGPWMGLEHPWVLGWAIFRSPAALVAFFLFYVGALASSKRAPFDLPEAESELVAGYHTEYSGLRFSFFFMAEYASMYVLCALAAILFLGGWKGGPLPALEAPQGGTLGEIWSAAVAAAPEGLSFMGKVKVLASGLTQGLGWQLIASQAIGIFNLLFKTFVLYFVMIWVRWTLPRIRLDQVMYICLKVLLPFGLACLVWALLQVAL